MLFESIIAVRAHYGKHETVQLVVSDTFVEFTFTPQATLINTRTAYRQHTGAESSEAFPFFNPPVLFLLTRPQRRSTTGISMCEHVRIISTSRTEEKGRDVGTSRTPTPTSFRQSLLDFQVNEKPNLLVVDI